MPGPVFSYNSRYILGFCTRIWPGQKVILVSFLHTPDNSDNLIRLAGAGLILASNQYQKQI